MVFNRDGGVSSIHLLAFAPTPEPRASLQALAFQLARQLEGRPETGADEEDKALLLTCNLLARRLRDLGLGGAFLEPPPAAKHRPAVAIRLDPRPAPLDTGPSVAWTSSGGTGR